MNLLKVIYRQKIQTTSKPIGGRQSVLIMLGQLPHASDFKNKGKSLSPAFGAYTHPAPHTFLAQAGDLNH